MKKFIFAISFLAVFGLMFNFSAPTAQAMTAAELQVLIQQLRAQILELQGQIAEIEVRPDVWCYNFNRNLKHGDTGLEVRNLQTALEKQGFYKRAITGNFDTHTAAAVVGFQEKHREDVLAPWNLPRGTGFVGSTTRAKLNELFGCDVVAPPIEIPRICLQVLTPAIGPDGTCRVFPNSCLPPGWRKVDRCPDDRPGLWSWDFCTSKNPCTVGQGDCDRDANCVAGLFCAQNVGRKYGQHPSMDVCERREAVKPSITVISPNGGERLELGKTHEIRWDADGMDARQRVDIYLKGWLVVDREYVQQRIARNILANTERFSWRIQKDDTFFTLASGEEIRWDRYKIFITTQGLRPPVTDRSDNYFSIIKPEVRPSITVMSPDGRERWTEGKTYEIRWDAVGMDARQKVDIILYTYKGVVGGPTHSFGIGRNILANTERFSWRIPITWPGLGQEVRMDKFKILITAQGLRPPVSDRSDNYFSIVEKLAVELLPDLTVTSLSVTIVDANKIRINYCIKNIGHADVVERFYIQKMNLENNIRLARSIYPHLAFGEQKCGFSGFDVPTDGGRLFIKGKNRIQFVVDSRNQVKESNEANNKKIVVFDTTAGIVKPSITSTSPTSGRANDMITIRGRNLVDTIPSGIIIEFLSDGRVVGSIGKQHIFTQADGLSLRFELSGLLVANSDPGRYQIRVISDHGKSNTLNFSILPPIVVPSITVISPNGGEQWRVGDTREITWDAVGMKAGSEIDIYLNTQAVVKGRRPIGGFPYQARRASHLRIANNIPANLERFLWTIQEDDIRVSLSEGETIQKIYLDRFKISVLTQHLPFFFGDNSDSYFSIAESVVRPSITITSPTAGQDIEAGTIHKITWRAEGFNPGQKIWVKRASGGMWTTLAILPYNATSFDWRVPRMNIKISNILGVGKKGRILDDKIAVQIVPFAAAKPSYIPGEVLLRFREGVTLEEKTALINRGGFTLIERVVLTDIYRLKIPTRMTVSRAIENLRGLREVKHVQPNYIFTIGLPEVRPSITVPTPVGLRGVEYQLASVSETVRRLIENIGKFLAR